MGQGSCPGTLAKLRNWNDPNIHTDLLEKWNMWENELADLCKLKLPRCPIPTIFDVEPSKFSSHVFGDASKFAYGSAAYLLIEQHGNIHISFIMACSRVAPKQQLSMPHLELCAALINAQPAKFLRQELTIAKDEVKLWTDSTILCRYKMYIETRVAEIQELTKLHSWRYLVSSNNLK